MTIGGTWLTVGQAVERMKAPPKSIPISAQTLRRMADAGTLPSTKVGSHRRFAAVVIEALKERMWSESHPTDPKPPAESED